MPELQIAANSAAIFLQPILIAFFFVNEYFKNRLFKPSLNIFVIPNNN